MKDYSAMSDYEINLAVAHLVLGSGNYGCDPEKKEVYTAGVDGGELLPNGYFQPCNNPADAWPILMANHIGIMPFKSGAATAWPTSIGLLSNFHVKHENPLRAAMICYLMMKDAEKCYG